MHHSHLLFALDNTLTFSDGSYVTRSQMELMFDVSGGSGGRTVALIVVHSGSNSG